MKTDLVPHEQSRRKRFDSPLQEAYLSLWRTYDRLRAVEDRLFAEHDLTPQQYNVLRLLESDHPEPAATLRIASRLVSRAPDITRMIDKLEARGWVARTRTASDRRAVMLALTPAGLHLLAQLAQPLARCHVEQLGHLTRSELEMFVALLEKVRRPHEASDSPWSSENDEGVLS
jgi:DNA-binding MarR family transcriptional regulator